MQRIQKLNYTEDLDGVLVFVAVSLGLLALLPEQLFQLVEMGVSLLVLLFEAVHLAIKIADLLQIGVVLRLQLLKPAQGTE